MAGWRVNAMIAGPLRDEIETPLSRSSALPRVTSHAVQLSRLYGRSSIHFEFGDTSWRFAWLFHSDCVARVELLLRVGGAPITVGLEDLQLFGSAVDAMRPQLSAELRAAYLNGCASAVWERCETIMRRTVELVAVRIHEAVPMPLDSLGFELEHEARGVGVRGFMRVLDPALQRTLIETSLRETRSAPVRPETFVRWSAIVGKTQLSSRELQSLEEHDVIVIDDAVFSQDVLECSLGLGPTRQFAGRLSLRQTKLHLIEFNLGGHPVMSPPDQLSGVEEIPVTVRFEVAQWQAPLGEVSALAPGAIIDLGQRVDAESVSVWVEQRCIGKGQLVAIGERLGVRLLSATP